MSRFVSVKCKAKTWHTINNTIMLLRKHGVYLKKNEVIDLGLRRLLSDVEKLEETKNKKHKQ
jgi:hypothetical protein